MRPRITLPFILLALAVGYIFPNLLAVAQTFPQQSIESRLRAFYKLGEQTTTVFVIQMDGIVGVPPGSAVMCPLNFQDGNLGGPDPSCLARVQKPTRILKVGEKVTPGKIEVDAKNNRVLVTFTECDACNNVSPPSSYNSIVSFQFPEGYLGAADTGQIVDVISQVLSIDAPPAGSDPGNSQSAQPQALTNADIIKMVQAHLPESVVIAKIKSSTSQFDTSPDALIKLNQAGASPSELQAIVDARAQSNPSDLAEDSRSASTGKESEAAPTNEPSGPPCGSYDSCVKIAEALIESSQWARAVARFQEASQFDPSRGDAWAGIGKAYFQMGQYEDAVVLWDKALQMGSNLSMSVCHAKALCGDTGTFQLNTKEVSFVNKKGEKEFAAAPSAITSEGAVLFGNSRPAYYLQIRFNAKNYRFYFLPKVTGCSMGFICPEPGPTQQKVFGDYLHERLVRMAAGDFGSQTNKP
jgi:Flp pilus assembly protein TadD